MARGGWKLLTLPAEALTIKFTGCRFSGVTLSFLAAGSLRSALARSLRESVPRINSIHI